MQKPHLNHDSVEDWVAAENVPPNFGMIDDVELRDKYITEYGELRRHLFAKHAATLSSADQRKLNDGEHPSQSHSFASDAEPYCDLLDSHLKSLGIVANEIVLGWYHMDRIVLTVTLNDSDVDSRGNRRPWLFQGFEVFYIGKHNEIAT